MGNPKKLFVVSAISRADIAKRLNESLGRRVFKRDDKRLTDKICTKYAALLGDCNGETEDEIAEKAEMMTRAFLEEHFRSLS